MRLSHELDPKYDTYNMITFIKTLYERGISCGQFAAHNNRASAVTLMSALDGVLSYLVMNESIELAVIIKDFEDQFINSVLAHGI